MRAQEALDHAAAALGGSIDPRFDGFSILGQAATFMESMREWRYTKRTARNLQFRPSIVDTTASFVGTTGTLSKAGLFASYTLVPGDFVSLTLNGTDFGEFAVLSRVDDDSITVADSPTSATFAGTASMDLNTSRVALPSDVGRLTGVFRGVPQGGQQWAASLEDLTDLDTSYETGSTYTIGYTVEWAQLTSKSVPVQTLRIWPEPQTAEVDAVTITYLRDWPKITGDQDVLPIPRYMEQLFLECVRMTVMGYDESMRLDQILTAFDAGPVYEMACRYDVGQQRFMGKARHSAVLPRRMWRDEGDEFVLRHIQN